MEAIVIAGGRAECSEALARGLQHRYGAVVCYHRGRRMSGGIVPLAEARLRRAYPEQLLQDRVFVLFSDASSPDLLDDVLGLVAQLSDPSGIQVRWLPIGLPDTAVGSSAGN